MTKINQIRDWLFKVLTVQDTLDNLEKEGLFVHPTTDDRALQRVLPLDSFSSDIRKNAMRTLPVYLAFFCLENAMRELVSERLSEIYGSDWWENCANSQMKKNVKSRKEKEGKNRWHVRRGEAEIYYTDFGDLKSLIRNNWYEFEDLFPDQNWVITRLDELEASRNIIAHNNVLESREVDRIRLYLDDWIRQVG